MNPSWLHWPTFPSKAYRHLRYLALVPLSRHFLFPHKEIFSGTIDLPWEKGRKPDFKVRIFADFVVRNTGSLFEMYSSMDHTSPPCIQTCTRAHQEPSTSHNKRAATTTISLPLRVTERNSVENGWREKALFATSIHRQVRRAIHRFSGAHRRGISARDQPKPSRRSTYPDRQFLVRSQEREEPVSIALR